MSTDLQQNLTTTKQQTVDLQTDELLTTINNYVQQFDATTSAETELPEIQEVLAAVDEALTPYFKTAQQQVRDGVNKTQAKDAQRGAELKKESLERLPEFQDYAHQVVHCFLKGYHYKARMLRGTSQAKNRLGNIQIDNPGEVGDVLAKKRKEKNDLGNLIDFINNARPVLDKVDQDAEKLEQSLNDVLGKDDGAAAMRGITAKLRKQDFQGAGKTARELKNKKPKGLGRFKSGQLPELARQAEKLVDYYKNNSAQLFTEDSRSFLRTRELDLAETQAQKEYDMAERYLRKYYIAYLIAKRQSLEQVRERLKSMGSPESVLNQHRRLVEACGKPIADMDNAYSFEERYLVPMKQMVGDQLDEIQRVDQRLERFMNEFDSVIDDIANYEEAMVE